MTDTILFVDDHQNILDGLKRMLRGMRNEWDTVFAQSANEALEIFEQRPIDVIVSDMRMPGMDGADLLATVREKYPATIRIILSGYSDKETIYRTLRPAHQYLAKPCDAQLLIDTIKRVLNLQGLLDSQELRVRVAAIDGLPALPNVYGELVSHLTSADASAESVAAIIGRDLAMTTQIEKLTNSSFFGLPASVNSTFEAIRMLGLDTIKQLVLDIGIFVEADNDPKVLPHLERLSRVGNRLGALAKEIAEAEGYDEQTADLAGSAAELCQVGALLLASQYPDKYFQARDLAKTEDITAVEAERRVFGPSHAEVGAYLLGLWGFPETIVRAAAFHHDPRKGNCTKFDILAIVYAAHSFAKELNVTDLGARLTWHELDTEFFAALGKEDRLPVWRDLAEKIGAKGAAA